MIRYRDDPLAYFDEVLGARLWSKLEEIVLSVRDHQRTLVMAGHGVGKTWTVGGAVNWYFDVFSKSIIPTTAPTSRQVKDLLWKEIRSQRRTLPEPDTMQLRDPDDPDHYAVGFTARKDVANDEYGSHSAAGFHSEHLLYVLDEGPGVPTTIWNAMEGVIVGRENKVIAIGNPTVTSGPFFDAAKSGKWNVIQISVFDHPNIAAALAGEPEPFPGATSLQWIEDRLDDPYWCSLLGKPMGEEESEGWLNVGAFEWPIGSDVWYMPRPIAEAKMLGRFPTQTTDTVWSSAWIDAAANRVLEWQGGDPLEFGVDVARFGDDSTAIHGRRGPCSVLHESWGQTDTVVTSGRVSEIVHNAIMQFDPLPPSVIVRVDTTGGDVGTGVVDILKRTLGSEAGITVVAVGAGETPLSTEHFKNKRSELWVTVAELYGKAARLDLTRLDKRTVDILQSQLTAPKYDYEPATMKRVVEPKDKTKKRIGRSPDDADAFNLAYYGQARVFRAEQLNAVELKKPSTWTSRKEGSRWGTGTGGKGRNWKP